MAECLEAVSAGVVVLPASWVAVRGDVEDDRVVQERAPADGIRRHLEVIGPLSDDELIARIKGLEPLPDAGDDDPAWLEDAAWDRAEFLLAAAEAIGQRRLVQAIAPLFQRAALGDACEMMPVFRHGPERAVAPDWQLLASIMHPLVRVAGTHFRAAGPTPRMSKRHRHTGADQVPNHTANRRRRKGGDGRRDPLPSRSPRTARPPASQAMALHRLLRSGS